MTKDANDVVEVSADSVAEAIQKGLIQLGVDRDEVEIEVLSEGSRGIFGIGAEPARVRLTLRRPRVGAVEPPVEPAPEREAQPEPVVPVEQPPEAVEVRPAESQVEAAQIALDTVRALVDRIGVSADVRLRQRGDGSSENPILIDIEGEHVGLLIGRRGSTLQALQYITRLIVSRQTHEWTNIVLDVDGYRRRRERSLTELAHRMAERVRRNGRPIALEPMPPNERRIIHMALRDDPTVTTRSVGEGDKRKVTIRPRF
jgi:spoIIIJ-associated protein